MHTSSTSFSPPRTWAALFTPSTPYEGTTLPLLLLILEHLGSLPEWFSQTSPSSFPGSILGNNLALTNSNPQVSRPDQSSHSKPTVFQAGRNMAQPDIHMHMYRTSLILQCLSQSHKTARCSPIFLFSLLMLILTYPIDHHPQTGPEFQCERMLWSSSHYMPVHSLIQGPPTKCSLGPTQRQAQLGIPLFHPIASTGH